ncbi:hypothetical protein H0W91_04065 [Patescibacteria group bacterium]|nr:hypothetical protein [Patescibacteria group bacterium]
MSNLLAYIPTLNPRHIKWFKEHKGSYLFLITQEMAETFFPRLSRNMGALPTDLMIDIIQSSTQLKRLVHNVSEFAPEWQDPQLELISHNGVWKEWVMPDEEVSHAVFEKYLRSAGANVLFQDIFARWDMSAVIREQKVVPDVKVSSSELDILRMNMARVISVKSPDWWRQIGAVAFDPTGELLVTACNTHLPNEYETYIFGDPRLNVDAGQKGKYCSIHAEQAVIALCAKYGLPISGASVYVSTFPCEDCARWLAVAGVKKVFFREGYSVVDAQEILRANGVEIVQVVD